ncbi:MBOAT family protein [Aerosakkonemataceae cyanobacterium BLCC-F154]|uniref:MBOAT family protein n=1 Tax=Floridaenema fluviatile BLCC-F154 TaxID=3153640 RepID=A0ABV4Y8V6_9CYAN
MLFNSPEFIFLFLPIALLIFFQLAKRGDRRMAIAWLVAVSLFFYAKTNPTSLLLLISSIGFNYGVGSALKDQLLFDRWKVNLSRKWLLTIGIAVNLIVLGYFKYANFFITTVNQLSQTSFNFEQVFFPLAISFFTFQQIAYLVDVYRGETKEESFLNYLLFVSFFPKLIAGPIVRHQDMMPQFEERSNYRFSQENLIVGMTIFAVGFFKKAIFANSMAVLANPVFDLAAQGVSLTFFEVWVGALAYTLQLYFDFSGYSDMAIGIARMFGILLPLNFDSPYKALNISDFWRRWHITLSNFLRDYIYIPLGGNRKGNLRRYFNLMLTMLLGGLWHGAGWNFVIWGGLHGAYLVTHRQWQLFRKSLGQDLQKSSWWSRWLARIVTFFAVVLSWIFFRAENMKAVSVMLAGGIGFNGFSLPPFLSARLSFMQNLGIKFDGFMPNLQTNPWYAISGICFLLAIVWVFPNTQEWMAQYNPALDYQPTKVSHPFWQKLQWQPNIVFGILFGGMIFFCCKTFLEATPSDFIYFNF